MLGIEVGGVQFKVRIWSILGDIVGMNTFIGKSLTVAFFILPKE